MELQLLLIPGPLIRIHKRTPTSIIEKGQKDLLIKISRENPVKGLTWILEVHNWSTKLHCQITSANTTN